MGDAIWTMGQSLARSKLVAAGLLISGACFALWRLSETAYSDSWAPMALALEFLDGPTPDTLYEQVFFQRGIKFQYPPSALLYVDALRSIGVESQGDLNLLNGFLYLVNGILVSVLVWRLFATSPQWRPYRATLAAFAFLAALAYFPSALSYQAGQIQVLINVSFTVACLALVCSTDATAGIATAIATAIKPQFAPFLALALLRRQRKFAASMALTLGGVLGASVLRYGWPNHVSYVTVLNFLSRHGESYYWNNSINGIVHRLLGNGAMTELVRTEGIWHSSFPPFHQGVYLASVASGLLFTLLPFGMAWLMPRRSGDTMINLLLFSLGGLCFVMASPIAWVHHFAILLPVYFILLHSMVERRGGGGQSGTLALLCLSFVLTSFEFPRPYTEGGAETLLYVPPFFGACIALWLLLRELLARRGVPVEGVGARE